MDSARRTRYRIRILFPALAFLFALPIQAQVLSNVGNVTINAVVPQSLTVSVAPGIVAATVTPGAAATATPTVVVTTSWNLNPGLTGTVELFGYFDVPVQALSDGSGSNIPSSAVLASFNSGAFAAFTQTNVVGPAGGSLLFFTESITGLNKIKTRNDSMDLQIDLTAFPSQPAADYTGTLHLQARAL